MNRGLKLLSVVTTVVMYIVLQQGALVTNTGSGDGCGTSWPLCHGTFMPEWDYAAIIEFSHRAVSAFAGLLTLILAIWIWRTMPHWRLIRWLAMAGLGTVIFQGMLGAAAVMWPQPDAVLALHFGISLICFSAVFLVTVLLFKGDQSNPLPAVKAAITRYIWWFVGIAYVVVYGGAYVRHARASLACIGWPLCNGELFPGLTGPIGASFLHRLGALLIVIMTAWLIVTLRRHAPERIDLSRAAWVAMFLVLLQVASGAVMVLGYFNLMTQMIHSAIITLWWGALSYLCLQVLPHSLRAASPALAPEVEPVRQQA